VLDLLGQSLAENTELEVLNLADNKISSFQVKKTLSKDIEN
jgi:hypothetical protein